MISNLINSFSKYGKGVKSTVNRYSMPRMAFLNTLLHSQYFLYFIVFISFVTICAYALAGDVITIILFAIIAFLTSFFNKNMIVVLSVALIISIILSNTLMAKYKVIQNQQKDNVEGFDGKLNDEEEEKYDDNETKIEKKDQKPDTKKGSDMKKKEPDTKKKGLDIKKKDTTGDTDAKKKDLQLLKNDYDEFKGIQDKIMEGIQDINKELDKAEKFVNKYEEYKNKHSA